MSNETARAVLETQTIRAAIEAETHSRLTELIEIRTKLTSLGVGGLHIELVGVAWLVAGVVLATVPGEIAAFIPQRT